MKLPYIKISRYRLPTKLAQERLVPPQGLRTQLFSNSSVGCFKSHKNQINESAVRDGWDLYGFSSLSKKTRKSIHLQMSLHKRQQFLLSYLKTLSVGPAKV